MHTRFAHGVRLLSAFAFALVASVATAAPVSYSALLSGPNESPPNMSPGTGFVLVDIDAAAFTMRVQSTFSGLLGTTTNAHIHCCTAPPGTGTAGVATTTPSFIGFPLGVTSGTFDETYNMLLAGSYNPAFITANGGTPTSAFAAFIAGVAAGQTYFNIHTSVFPNGEIRGFLAAAPAAVPEPSMAALVGLGLASFALVRRRRR